MAGETGASAAAPAATQAPAATPASNGGSDGSWSTSKTGGFGNRQAPKPMEKADSVAPGKRQVAEPQSRPEGSGRESNAEAHSKDKPVGSGDAPPTQAEIAEYLDLEKYGKHKTKAKVDGKEIDVSIADLRDSYQLKQASERRMSEAAKLVEDARKHFAEQAKNPDKALELLGHKPLDWARNYIMTHPEIQTMARERPHEILAALGVDVAKFAETQYADIVRRELLSPEERAALERDRELDQYRNADRTRKETEEKLAADKVAQEKTEADNRVRSQAFGKVQSEIVAAIEATGRKPTPKTIYRITQSLLHELDSLPEGSEYTFDANRFVGNHRQSVAEHFAEWYENASPSEIVEALGERQAKALREHFVSQATPPPPKAKPAETRDAPKKGKTLSSIFPGVRTL